VFRVQQQELRALQEQQQMRHQLEQEQHVAEMVRSAPASQCLWVFVWVWVRVWVFCL